MNDLILYLVSKYSIKEMGLNGKCQRIEFCVWLLRFEMPMALMWQKGTSYRSLPFDGFWALSGYCAALLSNEELLGRLSETRFDVAIVDLLYNECGLAIPHSLGEGFIATIAAIITNIIAAIITNIDGPRCGHRGPALQRVWPGHSPQPG